MATVRRPTKHLQSQRLYLQRIETSQAAAILAGDKPRGILLAEGFPDEATLEVMERLVNDTGQKADRTFFIVRQSDKRAVGGIGFWFPEGPTCPRVGYGIVE